MDFALSNGEGEYLFTIINTVHKENGDSCVYHQLSYPKFQFAENQKPQITLLCVK